MRTPHHPDRKNKGKPNWWTGLGGSPRRNTRKRRRNVQVVRLVDIGLRKRLKPNWKSALHGHLVIRVVLVTCRRASCVHVPDSWRHFAPRLNHAEWKELYLQVRSSFVCWASLGTILTASCGRNAWRNPQQRAIRVYGDCQRPRNRQRAAIPRSSHGRCCSRTIERSRSDELPR